MNSLSLKPDFAAVRKRWDAYWNDELAGRPITQIVIDKAGVAPAPRPEAYRVPHGDIEKAAADTLAWAASREWLADSVPGVQITFAPDHFAMLLGAEMTYDDGSVSGTPTGWIHPCMPDYDWEIRFRPECFWWEKTVEVIRKFRKICDGHLIVSGPNMQGGLDALAALRDPQALLTDLLDCPDAVKEALARIDRALVAARAALSAELDLPRWGSVTRHGTYSTGLCDVPQCDFSAMISAETFREFQLPALIKETDAADGNIYHLDGKEALHHLPALAEAPKLHTIQWQPGSAGWSHDWSALYARIDSLGLGQMWGGTPEQILAHRKTLAAPHRLYVPWVGGIESRADAEKYENLFL